MRGNITCLTNPEKAVIGYVDASTSTTSEKFVKSSEEFYEKIFRQLSC